MCGTRSHSVHGIQKAIAFIILAQGFMALVYMVSVQNFYPYDWYYNLSVIASMVFLLVLAFMVVFLTIKRR